MTGTVGTAPTGEIEVWRAKALVPTLVLVGSLMAIVSSLGAPLIPTVARADHVTLSTAEWILTVTLLTGALATPIMGRLADGPRQRDVILAALVVVLGGCVLAGLSDSFAVVVTGRALQGLGLGLLPVTMAIARRHLPGDRAGPAIATLSITMAVGAGLGYPVTGVITEAFGFHAAYWFGAIAVGAGLVVAAVVLPGRSETPPRRFDVVGATTLTIAMVALLILLSEGDQLGWASGWSAGLFAVAAVLTVVWVRHELRAVDPLVDLRQVRHRSVLTADISGFLMCVAMYLFLPIIIEFVQVPAVNGYGFGASVIVSSLVFLPLSAGTFGASRFLALYERHFGTRTLIPLGSVIFAVSTLFFAIEHSSLWEAFVTSGAGGIGCGLTFAAMPGFIVRAVPRHETGSATGFYQVLRNVGLSVGSAFSAAVLSAYTRAGHAFPTVEGFRVALIIASGLCAATAVISFVLPGPQTRTAPIDDAGDEPLRAMEEESEVVGAGLMLADEQISLGPGAERR